MILHPDKLRGLHLELLRFATEAAHVFEAECDLAIVWGVRTEAEQLALWARGRTTKGEPPYTEENPLGRTVTRAQHAHETAHGRAAAFDFCPVLDGVWAWKDLELFTLVGQYAEAHGLAWGGRWPQRDAGHVELPDWKSLSFPFTPPKEQP